MLSCRFCDKECHNENSHRNHERCCPINPNRNYVNGMKGKISSKKGKTKFTDESIMQGSLTFKEKIRIGEYIPHRTPHTLECKERISSIMQSKMENRYTASKRILYNGVRFESNWEYELAIDLDKNKVRWNRPSPLLYFDLNNQKRRYYPDFYLIDYDLYLDPKNPYVRILDKEKIERVIEQNKIMIMILDKTQLSWDYIKKNIPLR